MAVKEKCNHEDEIINDILEIVKHINFMNKAWYKQYWHNNHCFYNKNTKATYFLDWRRWLYDLKTFCHKCWKKINYKNIKCKLKEYDEQTSKRL